MSFICSIYACPMLDWADDDIRELLLYDLDVPPDRKLHVISDPCSKAFHHNVGAGLWQAALELLDFTAGASGLCRLLSKAVIDCMPCRNNWIDLNTQDNC